MSISPASSASSISFTKRDLSPIELAAVLLVSSPEVVISTSVTSPPSSSATCPACASARALPRVPNRKLKPGSAPLAAARLERRDLGTRGGFVERRTQLEPEQLSQRLHVHVRS